MTGDFRAQVAERLRPFIEKGPVLFAGAGVGVRADLPDWIQFLSYLADVAAEYEVETASLMRKWITQGLLPEAAHLYKICPLIPEGQRWEKLVEPFGRGKYKVGGLVELLSLPFGAVVTTNYDFSLHEAAAKARGKIPNTLELFDPTLKRGPYLDDFYIARIHGRAEAPTTIILDTDDYERVGKDVDYVDFLMHVLCRQSCLFVGFSFHDPAIRKVLDIFAARVGPTFPSLHMAILPANARPLSERLERYNIAVLTYPEGQHDIIWGVVGALVQALRGKPRPARIEPRAGVFDIIKRFLSFCYARAKLAGEIQPLRNLVLEGLALGLIAEAADGKTIDQLASELRELLRTTAEETGPLVSRAVEGLRQRGLCVEERSLIRLREPVKDVLADEMNILVSSVLDRLKVRAGVVDPERYRAAVNAVLREVLLERGWDLGANFAAARWTDTFDIMPVLNQAVARHCGTELPTAREQLTRAIYHLVANPDDREARILVQIGRLSFGMDLAIERTHSGMLWSRTLPNRIYLDANVLLPLIVPNHPAMDAYMATLQKLEDSAKSSGVDLRISVAIPFLNEIVSHRRISREIIRDYGLETSKKLSQFVSFPLGKENVFVVAYASRVVRPGSTAVSFEQFLNEIAPYETEDALERFLVSRGITIVKPEPANDRERTRHNELRVALHSAYGQDEEWQRSPKLGRLIDHEALQLWQLDYEGRAGLRSLFVTADARVRRLVSAGPLAGLAGLVLSPVGVIQLVDLLVGVRADGRSFARVMWGVRELAGPAALHEYFVDKGLGLVFAEAGAKAVPDLLPIVAEVLREAERAAERDKISLRPMSPKEMKRTLTFLDPFEERFYEKMRKEIERRGI